ncbi:MAG TPA: BolA family protein [Alphaproteobacteria bacterium]|nr:BolA family transcriptional regulator [Alphaproteobacteria bacterium]HRK97207.1 BolA family protein [Alphaproteobacteria bacterium]
MSVRERIIKALEEAFSPFFLQVDDFSEKHIGHSGYRDGGESHFEVIVVSDLFVDKSLTERHRMIYHALDEEIRGGVHALKIKTLTVEEAKTRKMFI